MFSMFDKLKSIFFYSNAKKRKSSESIEILSDNICDPNDKENKSNEISVYSSIYNNDNNCNAKLKNPTIDNCEINTVKSNFDRRKLNTSLSEKTKEVDNIQTIYTKSTKLPITRRIADANTVLEVSSKRTKPTNHDLPHFNFNNKSHLLDRNLIDNLVRPSIYADSRQSQLKILNAETANNHTEAKKLETTYIQDLTERFCELWWTQPTVLPRLVKKPSLPKINDDMRLLVATTLKCKKKDTVVTEEFSLSVTVTDIYSLQPRQWLTDNIINFYLELINARNNSGKKYPKVQILTSFFYPKLASAGYAGVKRWTKRRPIFDSQLVLVPIHLGNHWCLVTIDLDNYEVFYYDSLKSPNPRVLNDIKDFLVADSQDKLNRPLHTDDWTFKQKYDGPAQTNGYDCGIFLCQTAEYASRRAKLDFRQEQMDYFREKMSYEILTAVLM